MKNSLRKYNSPSQYFHNYEHDPEGRTHCIGPQSNPYTIEHVDGKHKITTKYAKGHGKGCVPQWFIFTKQLLDGFDLASGVQIEKSEIKAGGMQPNPKGLRAFKDRLNEKHRRGH
jgi:hypothetical protein